MKVARMQTCRKARARGWPAGAPGFTVIEALIALTILAVAILGIVSMAATGHGNGYDAGEMTMALTAARQMLEDTRALPFDNLANLNGFETNATANLPAGGPERTIARRWRYALAGEGNGFAFTAAEKAQWSTRSMGNAPIGGSERISVVD